MERRAEGVKFCLTYVKGFVLFAVEAEGHGEDHPLGCPVIKFGVLTVTLVQTVGIKQGCCRKAEGEV